MAALQPPRNSVTDGDPVFIAGVIGNTHTHTHTHTSKYKEIDTFKCTHIRQSLCLHSVMDMTLTRAQASQAGGKVHTPSVHVCLAGQKGLSRCMNQRALSWEDAHCSGMAAEACLCLPHSTHIHTHTQQCLRPPLQFGTEAVHLSYLSRACQRVKLACENIYKTHLPLVRAP